MRGYAQLRSTTSLDASHAPRIVRRVPSFAEITLASSDRAIASRWNGYTFTDECIASTASANPFDELQTIEKTLARTGDGRARWAGYVSYESNRWIERLPSVHGAPDPELPTLAFWKMGVVAEVSPAMPEPGSVSIRSRSMSRSAYLSAIRRSLDYISAGDVFQINFAQSFSVATSRFPDEVWRHLQAHTPAAYGAMICFGQTAILSNSPERFFRIEPLAGDRRRITTRPIKGTRPRGPGMRDELERSEKDRAELAMIVDLSRNDLGRICEIGSVRVTEPRVIEEHPTLYHGVATIEGYLRPDVTLADVFRAMFPCGSITGCPKVRAMQIIDELEPEPRGPYCGAIGYVDSDGSAEFSVAIRTMTMRDGIARVHVGGGIVADSDPVEEHRETIVKARAMLRALGVSEADIDALDAQ